jgi:hypothetical protein
MSRFAIEVGRISGKMKVSMDEAARIITLELFNSVIWDTPVDTGRLRGNWQCSKNRPTKGTLERTQSGSGGPATADAERIVQKPGLYWLTNNLPYAPVVEFGRYPGDGPKTTGGYSNKAPAGMMRKNVVRIRGIYREWVK